VKAEFDDLMPKGVLDEVFASAEIEAKTSKFNKPKPEGGEHIGVYS
jgi:hypothetical protein